MSRKLSAVDSRKSCRVCLFEKNHCNTAVLKVAIYATEQFATTFVWKVVKCTKTLAEIIFSKNKTVLSLKVNETKLTLRNVFILDLFALGGEKESKSNEMTPILGLRLETLSLWKTHIRVFPDYFSFRNFLTSFSYF